MFFSMAGLTFLKAAVVGNCLLFLTDDKTGKPGHKNARDCGDVGESQSFKVTHV
jgi:hypothetical protein